MLHYLFTIPGALWLTGAGIFIGLMILVDLVRDAFTSDYDDDFTRVDHGEIVEVER